MFYLPVFTIIGYLFGSLSSAIIVCKLMKLPDPRTQGSNNPGATNVMRIGGKKAAYTTFAGDFLKGIIPVLIAQSIGNDYAIAGAGIGAFLGHLYPLYFGFKGGKGVATFVGVLIAVNPLIFLVFGLIWLAILFTTGYVSLASMLAAIIATIATWLMGYSSIITGLLFIITLLMIYKHRANITRLLNGTESHFKKDKKQKK